VLPRCIAAARRAVDDTRAEQAVIQPAHGRGYRFVAKLLDAPGGRPGDAPAPPVPAADVPAATLGASGFVGRTHSLARLQDVHQRAAAGHGAVALIVGEPGIGKTRLSEELTHHIRELGGEVLVGGCYEGDGAPAHWPWVQILREAVAATGDTELRQQLGVGAPDLAEIVPEIRQRFDDLATPTGPSGEQARFRLFDAVSRFAVARSAERPLTLILDDLHWADASSRCAMSHAIHTPCAS